MNTIRQQLIQSHIDENCPNAKIVQYRQPESGLQFYTAEQLQNVEGDWFPLGCYLDADSGKVVYGGRSGVVHTYTEGETGAGKTTRIVIQSIRALSSLKEKPSFMIVDIHGEIIENLYPHLKENGYTVRILNCDEPEKSDTYNPLATMARECMETKCIDTDTFHRLRRIAEVMQPVQSRTDPIWDRGARAYTNGCLLDKFEDLIAGDIPESCMTIYNVIENHHWLRGILQERGYSGKLHTIPHYKMKGNRALSVQKMIAVTNNAEKTRDSYFGVVENHYDSMGQPSFYQLSSGSTISIEEFIQKPTVIVIQSGNTKTGDDLISFLVNDIYSTAVKMGKKSPSKKLPRKIHCYLDEFANCDIAEGKDFIKMLTTSRKFGMYWHMILQCDAQLEMKYDEGMGRIIRSNCTEIFMGAHDYDTKARFARSCGKKTIESLGSRVFQQAPGLETVDLMTPERLNTTPEGVVYIKANKEELLCAYYEAFYNCPEFVPVEDIGAVYPENRQDYTQTAFFPSQIPEQLTLQEYQLLEFMGEGEQRLEAVQARFPDWDIHSILRPLALKGVLWLYEGQLLQNAYTPLQMEVCRRKIAMGSVLAQREVVESVRRRGRSLWEDDDDDEEPYKTRKPPREIFDPENYEQWCGIPRPLKNQFLKELAEYMQAHGAEIPFEQIEELSMVPDHVKQAVQWLQEDPGGLPRTLEAEFPNTPSDCTYEILETYIDSHNFREKKDWQNQMVAELAVIESNHLFPEIYGKAFREAVEELTRELSMNQIREIKRLCDNRKDDD